MQRTLTPAQLNRHLMLATALLCLMPLIYGLPRVAYPPTQVAPVNSPALQVRPLAPHDGLSAEQRQVVDYLTTKYRRPRLLVERTVKAAWRHAGQVEVSPYLVLAIIEQESSFRPHVASSYGAVGLMQVVPRWHSDKLPYADPVTALKDPETNVAVGTRIIAEYLRQKKGDVKLALQKYSGNARNYANKVLRFKAQLKAAGLTLAIAS